MGRMSMILGIYPPNNIPYEFVRIKRSSLLVSKVEKLDLESLADLFRAGRENMGKLPHLPQPAVFLAARREGAISTRALWRKLPTMEAIGRRSS